jgi:hypothetical protein
MAQVIFAFRQTRNYRRFAEPRRGLARHFDAFRRWLADWRADRRRLRAEVELRWKLEGYSDHLLRDMGLTWDDGRTRRRQPDRCPWS